jgi:hypothetical protein
MLDKTTHTLSFKIQQASHQVLPIYTIDAQNLAKASRSAGERARLAAEWVTGWRLIEKRTAALGATIFGCSAPSVHRALDELGRGGDTDVALAHFIWTRMTQAQQDTFARANLAPLWDAIDRVTR